jgi:aspartate 4-decarboxylase
VHEYLQWAMCGNPRPAGKFDLYAVEGGTAAMCYLFKSLKANRLLPRRHDRARHADLHAVPRDDAPRGLRAERRQDVARSGRTSSSSRADDLKKLEDPKIKAFFSSTRQSERRRAEQGDDRRHRDLVKTKRPT